MSEAVRAYLSLGSNLGDRLSHLALAVKRLEATADVSVVAVSPVYETAAIGESGAVVPDEPSYLNCAIAIDTTLDPVALRARTAEIERAMGRGSHGKWEPRTIDIDLVLYGDQQISTATVTVPHPRMMERAFVLRPLVDLDAAITAPGAGALADKLLNLPPQSCELHTSAAEFQRHIRG
jgi:2-amino-4-hydroxy-6-hydroxymethyldihydropteridine diphosphokinase